MKIRNAFHSQASGVSLLLVATVLSGVLAAGDPPSILSMFRRKLPTGDAQTLALKAEHGPWMILATTLSGDDAQQRAVALANEIRSTVRLPSYVLKKNFDNSGVLGSTEKMVNEIDGSTTRYRAWMQYANRNQAEVYAVLVGEFSSTEDPRIQPTLDKIRTAQPKTLGGATESNDVSDSNWMVQKYRSMMWSRTDRQVKKQKGPMGAAFVTRNPLLPDDFFQAPKVDEFVENLNKQVEHSLLKCPKRFTVRVASFYGYASTELGGTTTTKNTAATDALDQAADQANRLTLALREKGVEAYQFHDRVGSYVMVGSFDELGREGSGGFQYEPQMLAIMQRFCGYELVDAKDPATGAISRSRTLKSLNKIPFDIEGKPMAVPRRETSGIYSGSLLGGR